MMHIASKLPHTGTSIFTVMSALAHEHGAINLSQGFPDFEVDPALIELVHHHMKKGYNQYAPLAGVPRLNKQIARKTEITCNRNIDPAEEITITAGATQALFTAIAALIHPGDRVILFDPAYDSYAPSIELQDAVPVHIPLHSPEFRIDWSEVEDRIDSKTRMIIINNPHNPTGKVLEKEDLLKLEELTLKHDLLVLSDEVYEHILFDGREHQSVLQLPELYNRSLATFSFGKTFHATGWKTGYCIAPPHLTREFRKVHQFNVFCVNTPLQMAFAEYLEESENYLQLSEFYEKKRDLFSRLMEKTSFRPVTSEGTYFQLYDYSELSDDDDMEFARTLTRHAKVGCIPISPFYDQVPGEKLVRFCFAKEDKTLEEAVERLVQYENS